MDDDAAASVNGERADARVVLLGFGEFERHALSSYLRLAGGAGGGYRQVDDIDEADYVIADTDHPGVLDIVLASERVADTVFIGTLAPDGALGWAMRPIDPLQVFREIDTAVALRRSGGTPAPVVPTTPGALGDMPMRRAGDLANAPQALVVDDSEIALRFLQRQLDALGLRSDTAHNSEHALQQLSQHRYDVVFLDVELGPDSEVDGLALCQQLKRAPRAPGSGLPPKVVMVTAHDSATARVRGTFAGCDAYLTKPFDEQALLRQLRQVGVLAEPLPPKRRVRSRRSAAPSGGSPSSSL